MALIADKTFSFNLARAQLLQDVFQADQQDPSLGMRIVTRTGTVSTSRRVMQLWSRLVRDVMSSLPASAAQETPHHHPAGRGHHSSQQHDGSSAHREDCFEI